MKFYFLGTGNAFGHGGRRRSHYLMQGSENWLIDASYDALAGLRSIGLSSKDLDKIFISHLHPDHYMAIPQFALEDYYVLKKTEPIQVYGPVEIKETIFKATQLFFNDEVVEHLNTLYQFIEVDQDQVVNFDNGKLETFEADHTGNARMQKITMDELTVGYTGDTAFLPETFNKLLDADITITEASSGQHFIPHHTRLQELLEYQISEEKNVYISHVGESTIAMKDQIFKPLVLAEDGMILEL